MARSEVPLRRHESLRYLAENVGLLLLYYALVASGITIAGNARDAFGRFVAFGATAMIFWHAFVNMGMVTGLLPVVGVTLPLLSYGGSSVLAVYVAIGLLAGVGARRFVN